MTAKFHAADTILLNGFVYTIEQSAPHAEALAISEGKLIAVGTSQEIRDHASSATEVIDLQGRMIMPGLVDGHCHPAKGAIANLFSCKFAFSATPAEIARAITERIERDPEIPCIMGGRWGSSFFEEHNIGSPRVWLDQISQGRAVYLRDDSGHNGWANSQALRLAGISRNSADPEGGKIIRDAQTGEPDGRLLEEADSYVRNRLPDWTPAQYRAGVLEMVRIANAYGITGVTDADASEPLLNAYRSVDLAGALTVYVAASITTPYGHRDTPLDYASIEVLRDKYASPHVDTRFAKIYEDGVPTSARTAAMLAPYLPHAEFAAGFSGMLHVDESTLTGDIAELERRGFTVKLHTAGDRSVRVALNAIEKAHAISGRSDLRHELAHAGFIAPSDIPRFKRLNVVADLSPYLWHPSPINCSIVSALGERGEHYWPIRDLLEAGAPLLTGSDWPAAVPSMDPWIGLEAMVTRRDPARETPGVLWAEQAINLEQALRIFTLDGARALRREAETGSLKVGKSADFIVLGQNLFRIAPEEIAATVVETTFFAGKRVFQI